MRVIQFLTLSIGSLFFLAYVLVASTKGWGNFGKDYKVEDPFEIDFDYHEDEDEDHSREKEYV